MSNTPEEGRESLPVSAGHRTVGSRARAGRAREPGRPAPIAGAAGRAAAREAAGRAAAREAAGRAAAREAAGRAAATRIGIRELRQHASVYVDLAEKGYTVDITNRGRLVARLVPVREPGSPLERLIAAGIIEPAEEDGGIGDISPYPAPPADQPTAGGTVGQIRQAQERQGQADQEVGG
jgi:prevent-host-death family protein